MKGDYLSDRTLYPLLINKQARDDLKIIVVIPAYKEQHLNDSLTSLNSAVGAISGLEVIVVVNGNERDGEETKRINQSSYKKAMEFAEQHSRDQIQFHILSFLDLNEKESGVGVARKIGLDEGLRRFKSIGNENGLLVCFDGDSLCKKNYFEALIEFYNNSSSPGASIFFEHVYDDLPEEEKKAIISYELHLRTFIGFQRWLRLPYAFQTVGSSMVVKAGYYEKLWGMNKRQAGEDFYYLQKFIQLGNFYEINNTVVYPSSRASDRVPFGTGKAVAEMIKSKTSQRTYNPTSFLILQELIKDIQLFYKKDSSWVKERFSRYNKHLKAFFTEQAFPDKIYEINTNTNSIMSFEKRFFNWFNAFKLMKYLHYMRFYFSDVSVEDATSKLLELEGRVKTAKFDIEVLLLQRREIDKLGYQL